MRVGVCGSVVLILWLSSPNQFREHGRKFKSENGESGKNIGRRLVKNWVCVKREVYNITILIEGGGENRNHSNNASLSLFVNI